MKKLPELLCLLTLLGLPARAAEPQPSPTPDPVTVYRLESASPEFLALTQVAYPLGLGYLLQGEHELGGLYMGLQGGMLLGGTLWGPSMGGSSWTQLLPNLSLGLWLISLAHVDALARIKNAELARRLGLNHDQVRELRGAAPFGPEPLAPALPRWETRLGASLLLDGAGNAAIAAGPGLQLQYPLGGWLRHYTGESWLGQLDVTVDLQGFWPVWASQSGTGMATAAENDATSRADLRLAPGLSSGLGLVYQTPTEPWSWYFGAGWSALWRSAPFAGSGSQASWQGVSALGGLRFSRDDQVFLNLGLELGLLGFSGSTGGMGEQPALIRLQPFVSGSFRF